MHVTYLVPEDTLNELERRLDGLRRAARSLDLQFDYRRHKRRVLLSPVDEQAREAGHRLIGCAVTLEGETPALRGWRFIAALRHLGDSATLFSPVPGEAVPERYRAADPHHCDQCGLARNRKETFLVGNAEGALRQIGRDCLRDFLQHPQPWKFARFGRELVALDAELSTWSQTRRVAYPIEKVLTHTALLIEQHGWVSRSEADRSIPPKLATADSVLEMMWQPKAELPQPNPKHRALARSAIDWAYSLPKRDDDNYLGNLRVLARHGWVDEPSFGLAVSLLPSYRRARAAERELQLARESAVLPHPGDRKQFELEVTHWTPRRGHYGVTHCYGFVSSEGLRMTWFASNRQDFMPGDTVLLKGTVKKIDTFRGQACAYLTRCKVLDFQHKHASKLELSR